jgi:hypothetical protein
MDKEVIPIERIARAILVIRGEKMMLDSDLAALYGVTTGNLNKAVKRNAERFPTDFMFQLDAEEVANLKFQFGISSWGGRRRLPYAFTEQGVAMLSSVLNSERAVNRELARKFAELERRVGKHDDEIAAILEAIRKLIAPLEKPQREIGFHVRERAGRYRAPTRA